MEPFSSMNPAREVVVTGVGVVSPIGIGIDAYAASMQERRSGIVPFSPFHEHGMPFHLGAPVRDFDGKNFVQPRKSMKVMSREIQIAYAAADLAIKHAGIDKGSIDPERFGAVLGSEMIYGEPEELIDVFRHCIEDGRFDFGRWGHYAMADIFPLWMLKYLPNMAACHIGIAHDARGPNNSITLGEVSSLLAIIEATNYIRRGLADVVLAGGLGSRLSVAALPFRGHDLNTNWQGEPGEAIRPFDADRDGYVNGEGSGVLVLESREHAEKRGAKPLAKIAGYASRSEPAMREQLTGTAIRNSITGALQSANLKASDIAHVNAHGVATKHDDHIEAIAIRETLDDVPVTAPKSFFGHLGASGGSVEIAASVWSIMEGIVPATLNYKTPDKDCPVNVVREPLTSSKPAAIKLSFNTTGQAVAVVLSRP